MTITTRTYSRLISSFFKLQDLYREYSGSFDDDEDSHGDEDDEVENMEADDNENSFKRSADIDKVEWYFRHIFYVLKLNAKNISLFKSGFSTTLSQESRVYLTL